MRQAPSLSKVTYDPKLQVLKNALGTHTTVSRVQGFQLKAKREIRIGQPIQRGTCCLPAYDRRA